MHILENKGLYITRKRKKWKFAHFDSYPNCFFYQHGTDPSAIKNQLKTYFSCFQGATLETVGREERRMVMELGAGNAQFSLQLAKLHPEYNFIAIDIKSDRLYTSAKRALEEGIENIAFLRMHIYELSNVFAKNSVDTIWLTFPDPFMRKRSQRRRLSHPLFLRQYRKIIGSSGQLKFKTDNRELFLWSLEQFVVEQWGVSELSFDLHESELSKEYKIMTAYEQKFIAEGYAINYGTFTP